MDSKPLTLTNLKPTELISWTPTERDILDATMAELEVAGSGGFMFHSVRVDERDTSHQMFQGSANFEQHVHRELTKESGMPTVIFFFFGAQINFSKPQVTVGLTTSGQKKPKAVILAKSVDNPSGEVPDRRL